MQYDGRGGDRSATKTDAAVSFAPLASDAPNRTEAARSAGISERQQVTAIRVANVPIEHFEAAVESDEPPTVTHNQRELRSCMAQARRWLKQLATEMRARKGGLTVF